MNQPDHPAGTSPGPFWQVRRVLRRHGLLGTVRLAWGKTVGRVFSPGASRRLDQYEQQFDSSYNIDTAGFIRPNALDIKAPTVEFASPYRGIDPPMFEAVLRRLDIDYPQFTFVDIGSGKGRAVLLACKLPFRKCIGVEFSPTLHRIACENTRHFAADLRLCHDIEFLCHDATQYDLPPGNLVLFFYNPFERNIFDLVVANIEQSLARDPRTIYMVLANVPFPIQPTGFTAVPLAVDGPMPVAVLRSDPSWQPEPLGVKHHA
jgi:SAM-dependent methyltransferase